MRHPGWCPMRNQQWEHRGGSVGGEVEDEPVDWVMLDLWVVAERLRLVTATVPGWSVSTWDGTHGLSTEAAELHLSMSSAGRMTTPILTAPFCSTVC
jgi:hypothetical protein